MSFPLNKLVTIWFAIFLVISPKETMAICRPEPILTAMEIAIAKKHFPEVSKKLPEIVGCDPNDFTDALGDFNPNTWRIRVLMEKSSLTREVIVAHELGHAQASLEGEEYTHFRGHGAIWIRVMIRAGFGAEAQRTAKLTTYYPGLLQVYQVVASTEAHTLKPVPEVNVIALLNERPAVLDFLLTPID
jgi:hypothetical protein